MEKVILRKLFPYSQRIDKYLLIDLRDISFSDITDCYGVTDHIKRVRKPYQNYAIIIWNPEAEMYEVDFYNTLDAIYNQYTSFEMFTKNDRSSFKYWFAHWCGYQLTALNLKIWKPKYLLHDIEKPWLKLLWRGDYKRVQKWHRTHNKHHLEYGLTHGWDSIDWEALMIDWECCALSKQEAQMNARETLKYEINKDKWKEYKDEISSRLTPLLNKYHL